jgi:hypothetical protein
VQHRPLSERHLRGEVGRGAEAVDAEPTARRELGPAQGAVADDAGAEQRGGVFVVVGVGKPVRVGLGHHGPLRVAAVGVPPGEARVDAQVLGAAPAPSAAAASVPQPGDARPLADREPSAARAEGLDLADDLVARDGGRLARGQIALGQVEIGPAHAAGRDPDADLARAGLGDGPIDELARAAVHRAGRADHPRLHRGHRTCVEEPCLRDPRPTGRAGRSDDVVQVGREVVGEPVAGEIRHGGEGAGFFEEVGGLGLLAQPPGDIGADGEEGTYDPGRPTLRSGTIGGGSTPGSANSGWVS